MFWKINHVIDLLFVQKEYEIHKDAIRGNEKTEIQMKGTEEKGKEGCSGEISNQLSVV